MIATLIETARLNGVEPYAYLKGILETLVNDFPQSRLDALMPWNRTAGSDHPTAVNA